MIEDAVLVAGAIQVLDLTAISKLPLWRDRMQRNKYETALTDMCMRQCQLLAVEDDVFVVENIQVDDAFAPAARRRATEMLLDIFQCRKQVERGNRSDQVRGGDSGDASASCVAGSVASACAARCRVTALSPRLLPRATKTLNVLASVVIFLGAAAWPAATSFAGRGFLPAITDQVFAVVLVG